MRFNDGLLKFNSPVLIDRYGWIFVFMRLRVQIPALDIRYVGG